MKIKFKSLLIMLGLTPGLSHAQTTIEAPKIEPPVMGVKSDVHFAAGNSGGGSMNDVKSDVHFAAGNSGGGSMNGVKSEGSQHSDKNLKVDPPKLKEKF